MASSALRRCSLMRVSCFLSMPVTIAPNCRRFKLRPKTGLSTGRRKLSGHRTRTIGILAPLVVAEVVKNPERKRRSIRAAPWLRLLCRGPCGHRGSGDRQMNIGSAKILFHRLRRISQNHCGRFARRGNERAP
jgi:hypothetical protein